MGVVQLVQQHRPANWMICRINHLKIHLFKWRGPLLAAIRRLCKSIKSQLSQRLQCPAMQATVCAETNFLVSSTFRFPMRRQVLFASRRAYPCAEMSFTTSIRSILAFAHPLASAKSAVHTPLTATEWYIESETIERFITTRSTPDDSSTDCVWYGLTHFRIDGGIESARAIEETPRTVKQANKIFFNDI